MVGGRPSLSAIVAALSFDFFFTKPYQSLRIESHNDVETTIVLLVVALISAEIGIRGRSGTGEAKRSQSEVERLYRIVDLGAQGRDIGDVVLSVQAELIGLFDLEDCDYEAAAAYPLPKLGVKGTMETRPCGSSITISSFRRPGLKFPSSRTACRTGGWCCGRGRGRRHRLTNDGLPSPSPTSLASRSHRPGERDDEAREMIFGMAHGELRIYLGAAPGVGKTFAMLNEGRRRDRSAAPTLSSGSSRRTGTRRPPNKSVTLRSSRGARCSTEGRRSTKWTSTRSWPAIPTGFSSMRWRTPTCPARRARSGGRTSRYCSTAGINVISTLNIQHLESMNDVVEQITGIKQQEKIPDAIVRHADQVELVDMTPEALRRRMAHGNIYSSDRVDAALANYFRVGNLGALRELALMWLADKVDDALLDYRQKHGIERPWETRRTSRRRAHRRAEGRGGDPPSPRASAPARMATSSGYMCVRPTG